MNLIRLASPLFLLILTIIAFIPSIPAISTHVGYTSANLGGSTCGINCQALTGTQGTGMGLKAPMTGKLESVDLYVGAVAPNQVVLMSFNLAGSPSASSFSCSGGATCYNNVGQGWTVQQVQAVGGLTTNAFNTIILPTPLSVTLDAWYGVIYMYTPGTASGVVMFCGATCGSGSGQPTTFMDLFFSFGTSTPSGSYNGADNEFSIIVGGTFSDVATGGTIQTQCVGNCGSPAITVVNTNSTKTVNFNQSITIFYQAQSNLNGIVKSINTTIGKTDFSASGQLGIYTVDATCTKTNNPFTPQCPGILSFIHGFIPTKGKISFNTNIDVANGQWIGISISAQYQGLIINDTNTAVTMYQTANMHPQIVSQFSTLTINKPQVAAFITGSGVIVQPPIPIPVDCPLVCGLLLWMDGFGLGRTGGALLGLLIAWVIVTVSIIYFQYKHGEVHEKPINIPGATHFLTFLVLVLVWSTFALPAWVPILIFIVFGWLFAGTIMSSKRGTE